MNTTTTGRATIEKNPTRQAMATPIQYLDKAMTRLRDLGLVPEKTEEAPIVALLNRVSDLDNDKVVAIARTLSQASLFNQVVREQVASMSLGERYGKITDGFNSIRDDAKTMVEQVEDGRIDTLERLANVWQKATRGDIAGRFDKIKKTLSRRRQGYEGPDRARAPDPPGVSGFPRRAEGSRGARAASAEESRGKAASRAGEAEGRRRSRRESVRRRSRRAREARAQARRGAAQRAGAPRTAIRSARTSPTT